MRLSTFATAGGFVLSQVLAWEIHDQFSREEITILAGSGASREIALGQVLGKILYGNVTITPTGGNTGNGALGTLTRGKSCKLGSYKAKCIAAAANGGTFQITDPDGFRLGDAVVGQAFVSSQLNFTIADGGTDFAVGDSFTVTVVAGSGKFVALDLAATDGSQIAAAVSARKASASDGIDDTTLAIVRDAKLLPGGLVWPAGINTNQKNAAFAELASLRLFVAQEA